MLRRRAAAGIGAGVGHPAGDLAVVPAEPFGAGAQAIARRRRRPGKGLHRQLRLDLVADRVQLADVEIVERVLLGATAEDVLRRAPVQPGVDLRAATGAAPFGVGDRRTAEGRGDATGAVLAVHLLQRERDDVALANELAFLDDDDVETRLGEQRRRRAAAGAGTDDEHVGVRWADDRPSADGAGGQRDAPSAAVDGHVSHT